MQGSHVRSGASVTWDVTLTESWIRSTSSRITNQAHHLLWDVGVPWLTSTSPTYSTLVSNNGWQEPNYLSQHSLPLLE